MMIDEKHDKKTHQFPRPIGGLLYAFMIILIGTGLTALIEFYYIFNNLTVGADWSQYTGFSNTIMNAWINIQFFLTISAIGIITLVIWALRNFFKKTKRFLSIFMTIIACAMLIEIVSVLMLNNYAKLTNQDSQSIVTNLLKIGIIGIISGLYLYKSKRSSQTFLN